MYYLAWWAKPSKYSKAQVYLILVISLYMLSVRSQKCYTSYEEVQVFRTPRIQMNSNQLNWKRDHTICLKCCVSFQRKGQINNRVKYLNSQISINMSNWQCFQISFKVSKSAEESNGLLSSLFTYHLHRFQKDCRKAIQEKWYLKYCFNLKDGNRRMLS